MILRLTNRVLRSSLWLGAGLIILLAAYLVLGRAFVYTFVSDKERVESLLKDSGIDYVAIGEVAGDWHVFDPVFVLSEITVSAGDEPAIVIDRLRVRVNSLRSFMQRSAVISEAELDGIRLDVIADDKGFRVRGLPRGQGDLNLDPVLDSVPYLNNIEARGVELAVQGHDYQVTIRSREGESWQVSGQGDAKTVSIPVYIEREGVDLNRINLTGQYQGDVRSGDFSADLYLSAISLELANFLPRLEFREFTLASANLSTEIWLRVEPAQVDVTGIVDLSSVSTERNGEVIDLVEESRLEFGYSGESVHTGTLALPLLEFRSGNFHYSLVDISAALETTGEVTAVAGKVPVMDIADVTRLVKFAGDRTLVPDRFTRGLAAVNPRGELQDIAFVLDSNGSAPVVAAKVVDFAMDAYLGIPAIDPLNGFLHLEPGKGYVDIDNDAFVLNFSNMFSHPWPFDSGRGRITYEVAENQVRVSSGLIELIVGELEAYGKVALNLPPTRDLQTWGLTLGISNADLRDAERYVPNTIPETLTDWLLSAILDGNASQSGLTFHGALFRGAPKGRKAHDLFYKVDDLVMKYHSDWPEISDVRGTVHVNNHFVASDDIQGTVYETRLNSADLYVPMTRQGQADTVLVDTTGTGPFSDIVRALNETPLADTTANMAQEWQGDGRMAARMKLNVPVGPRAGEEVISDVTVTFSEATLAMPEFGLTVESLAGEARYETRAGLSSNGFTGVTFGEAITGSVETQVHGDGGEIRLRVDGAISAESLYEWSDQVLLSQADGELAYRATVYIPYGGKRNEVWVEAASDLKGMRLDLPYPFEKQDAGEERTFHYTQRFLDDGYRIEMSLDDKARAALKVSDGIAVGGRVHFGQDVFGAVAYDRIRMTGQLDHLDFAAWMHATDTLGELTDVSLEDEIAAHLDSAELEIDELTIFELLLEDASVKVTRDEGAWLANIDNDMLLGDVRVEDDDTLPIGIHLDRLNFAGSEEAGDPLGDVDPLEIGDVDFSTDSLMIDGEDYGSWAFQFRIDDRQARFENLAASAAGLRVLPTSQIEWHNVEGVPATRFAGEIEVDDLAYALEKFGLASSIEGTGLKVSADVNWAGSPAMVDVDRVIGVVSIHEGEGRFVQAETGGALKLLGIFDFASIARRLRLDFSDVVEQGFEFEDISGVTSFDEGHIGVTEPIVIEGSSGRFTVGGELDLNTGLLDNEMIVTLPVTRTLPWYAAYSAIATGPLAGASVMIAQKVFENQIDQMSSAKYKISGSMDEPNIEFVAIFDDKVAEASPEAN